MAEGTKVWYASRTIWAQIIGLATVVAAAFGLDLAPIQAEIVTLIMGVVTIALRFVTTKPITVK